MTTGNRAVGQKATRRSDRRKAVTTSHPGWSGGLRLLVQLSPQFAGA